MIEPEGGPAREFDDLFVRIRPELEGYARSLLNSWQVWGTTAADVVHSAYLKLRSRPGWLLHVTDQEERVRYIRTSVRRAAADCTPGRSFSPLQPSDEARILDIAAPQSTTGPVTKADQRRFYLALRRFLPEEDQEILRLVADEGRSFDEVAERLDLTPRSVRRRYERIRDRLTRRHRPPSDEGGQQS